MYKLIGSIILVAMVLAAWYVTHSDSSSAPTSSSDSNQGIKLNP